jgi:hypothetical protein
LPGSSLGAGGGSSAKDGRGTVQDSYELDEKPKDRDLDMVLRFDVAGSGLSLTDTRACVRGSARTATGVHITFFGCDAVRPM